MSTFTLPWPPKALSPNARCHWTRKSEAARELKDAWFYTAMEQGAKKVTAQKLHLSLVFHEPDKKRQRDLDNMLASIKSGLDGLSLALGVDDSKWSLSISKAETIGGFVRVTVEEVA